MAAVYTALYAWRFNCTMWFNFTMFLLRLGNKDISRGLLK